MRGTSTIVALAAFSVGCITPTQRAAMVFGDTTTAAVDQLREALIVPVVGCHQLAVPRRTLTFSGESTLPAPDCAAVTAVQPLHADSLDIVRGFAESMRALGTLDEARTDSLGAAAETAGGLSTSALVTPIAASAAGTLPHLISMISNHAASYQLDRVLVDAAAPMGQVLAALTDYFDTAVQQANNFEAAVASVRRAANAQTSLELTRAASLATSLGEMERRVRQQQRILTAAAALAAALQTSWQSLTKDARDRAHYSPGAVPAATLSLQRTFAEERSR